MSKNALDAQTIIAMLGAPQENGIETKQYIRRKAPIKELILALQMNVDRELTRVILCELLGARHAKSAVPVLIKLLDDTSDDVRLEAADALGRIGDPQAGEALFELYRQTPDAPSRRTLSCALGGTHYMPAMNTLIEALAHEDEVLRGCAAWSLGMLGGEQAEAALKNALTIEEESFALSRIHSALAMLQRNSNS